MNASSQLVVAVSVYEGDEGWTFVDDDTLLIHGDACEKIVADGKTPRCALSLCFTTLSEGGLPAA